MNPDASSSAPTPKKTPVKFKISSNTTAEDVLAQLTRRQCPDVTARLDLSKTQQNPVGEGGFGLVYQGQLRDGLLVAIKRLRVNMDDPEGKKFRKAAAHELYTWSKAKHPNVLELIGLARFQGQLAMVSPWMDNQSLPVYLSKDPKADKCEMSTQIARGLAYLHEAGIVHGDVKSENVMVSKDGVAKLADFGSSILREYTLQFTGVSSLSSGTTRYCAPERLDGQTAATAPADVYALGMTILNVISGEKPFKGILQEAIHYTVAIKKLVPGRPEGTIPKLSDHGDRLWDLLLRCWLWQPDARPTAREVGDEMQGITQQGLRSQLNEGLMEVLSDDDNEENSSARPLDLTAQIDSSGCSLEPFFVGQMTEMYRGKLYDGTEVAIKRVIGPVPSSSGVDFLKHTIKEMHAWSKAKHNNVLQLLGAATFLDQFSLVSPWMVNGDLSNYLSNYPNMDRYPICVQIADGLAYLHAEGITHGNITAGNILISEDHTAKLADYGCAGLEEWSVSVTTVSFLGSCNMSWTPPELIDGQHNSKNYKTDIYSLGMIIYQITSTTDVPMRTNRDMIVYVSPTDQEVTASQGPPATRNKHDHMMRSLLENCWRSDPAARPDAKNIQLALNDIQEERRRSREVVSWLSRCDPISTIIKAFVDRGCLDLTHELNLNSSGLYPVSSGGFGDIYRGALRNGQSVAIKRMRILIQGDTQQSLKSAAREFYTWSKLKHPNILPLLGFVEFQGQLGIVSPWMENGNIVVFLHQHPKVDRLKMCIQIVNGLAYMHQNRIIHGDVKGMNILVSDDLVPMLTDFGTTRLLEHSLGFSVSTSSNMAVSPRWAAPELLSGEGTHSKAADVYAFGMVVLEILTGEVPFAGLKDLVVIRRIVQGRTPERPELTAEYYPVWALIQECWHMKPTMRPSAAEILAKLDEIPTLRDSDNGHNGGTELETKMDSGYPGMPAVRDPELGAAPVALTSLHVPGGWLYE